MTKIALAPLLAAALLAYAAAPSASAGSARSGGARAGEMIFAANCTGCHGAAGAGQPGIFPSLRANPYVSGDPKRVIHTVKFGLTGKIVAKGAAFDGQMPAWTGTLTDPQIADVITYIRTSWGNKGSAVTTAQVSAVKK